MHVNRFFGKSNNIRILEIKQTVKIVLIFEYPILCNCYEDNEHTYGEEVEIFKHKMILSWKVSNKPYFPAFHQPRGNLGRTMTFFV